MLVRLLVVLGVLALSAGFTWWWRLREGRFTQASGRFERTDLGLDRRARPSAMLVEFFGEHCAPCKTVQARIEKLAGEIPDVSIASIDAGARLDLSDRYEVRRVPTLFVTDSDLKIVWRASGVPSEDAIRAALLGPDWAGRPHPDLPVAAKPSGAE
ncbi:MAG: thioredoxin family protein [Actinomycetota bacterium]